MLSFTKASLRRCCYHVITGTSAIDLNIQLEASSEGLTQQLQVIVSGMSFGGALYG